jgi:hypothetical protein
MMNLIQQGLAVQKSPNANKVEVLRMLIESHDLTASDSDDHKTYNKGRQSWIDITNYVEKNNIDRKTFAELWNAHVDKNIRDVFRKDYYLPIEYS